MSCEGNAFFHQFCQEIRCANNKRNFRCRFCSWVSANNFTRFREHLCKSGSYSCPMIYKQVKPRAIAIRELHTAIRNGLDVGDALIKAVDEANNELAIILKSDNNRFGIPLPRLYGDVELLADGNIGDMELPVDGSMVPMGGGTQGNQIIVADGPFVGESSNSRANTLPKVDVPFPSSFNEFENPSKEDAFDFNVKLFLIPSQEDAFVFSYEELLNPSQQNAESEKDEIFLNLLNIEAKVAVLEQATADLKGVLRALSLQLGNLCK